MGVGSIIDLNNAQVAAVLGLDVGKKGGWRAAVGMAGGRGVGGKCGREKGLSLEAAPE